ncbi:MAG: ferredoxin:glutaredoxin reductase [Methanobrevibacter sp.]|jgi:ferredoxin-thioredoxin reductase catalytic subunit|nr:ferredoxin:glutaredoxin reductase [Candidatus Methanovirga basalitermitum]
MVNFGSYDEFRKAAEETGYFINEDKEFVQALLDSINVNIDRYGYGACPCRLALGKKEKDLDIICPCNYRDPDLNDYGACFCGLYVSEEVLKGEKNLSSIPDRRISTLKTQEKSDDKIKELGHVKEIRKLKVPIYRCVVCGYLCGREQPPNKCPICKADSERFERIL